MNLFKFRSKSFNVSECDPTYKVKYLGNVLTTFVRGDGCIDRPLAILWNNYLANPAMPKEMQLAVTNSGLQAVTTEQGLMEYRCHRIAYSLHHPQYPKLFVWVYRHEGRKMKVEVRCHAVLCKSESKAEAMQGQLRERLAFALAEFAREKMRRQNSRLIRQRLRSAPSGSVESAAAATTTALPVRTQLLSVGQNFKPPASRPSATSALDVISEEANEPETNTTATNRLSWQPHTNRFSWQPQFSSELEACSVEEDGQEETEDDSVFLFQPPDSRDCGLTDVIHFFESKSSSSTPDLINGFLETSKAEPLGNGIRCHRELDFSPPPLPHPPMETNIHPTIPDFHRTDPVIDVNDVTSASLVPESDDLSVESGFSEQDNHDS